MQRIILVGNLRHATSQMVKKPSEITRINHSPLLPLYSNCMHKKAKLRRNLRAAKDQKNKSRGKFISYSNTIFMCDNNNDT
jgi:hypothetical protein